MIVCPGYIAALVYTKQNNKIKTQASEPYTGIRTLHSHQPLQKHCDWDKSLDTGLSIKKGRKSQRFSTNITAVYTLFQEYGLDIMHNISIK